MDGRTCVMLSQPELKPFLSGYCALTSVGSAKNRSAAAKASRTWSRSIP